MWRNSNLLSIFFIYLVNDSMKNIITMMICIFLWLNFTETAAIDLQILLQAYKGFKVQHQECECAPGRVNQAVVTILKLEN